MLGLSVKNQMKHKRAKIEDITKKIYRTAKASDIEKWVEIVKKEQKTMLDSRYIAWDLNFKAMEQKPSSITQPKTVSISAS